MGNGQRWVNMDFKDFLGFFRDFLGSPKTYTGCFLMSYLLKKACMQSYTVSNNCITTRQNKEIQNHNDK